MLDRTQQLRPGLRFAHLRSIVRLRQASPWLGIFTFMALLTIYQLHRHDPALFERSSNLVSKPADPVSSVSMAAWNGRM